jgi:hypothetical protein
VGQRVLAAPAADDADLHAVAPFKGGAPGGALHSCGEADELLAARAHADQADRHADLLGQEVT